MGYAGMLKTVLNGYIESIDVSFGGNGLSQLTVKGYDHFKKLMSEKKKPFTWGKPDDKITYSEIVKKIVGNYNMSFEGEETKEKYSSVINDKNTDFEFIKAKLAKEVGYEVYVRDNVLHFHQPKLIKSICIAGMEWGKSLISFSPSFDTSRQVTGVRVNGWDHTQQKAITYTAGAGSESNRGSGKSGSETVQQAGSTVIESIGREELDTEGKVKQYSQAVLENRSQSLFSGSGECLGLPEIEPGRRIEILGLGERFSKKYYITKVNHSISSSGFKTQFTVADNTVSKKGSK
jgi:phage protein D